MAELRTRTKCARLKLILVRKGMGSKYSSADEMKWGEGGLNPQPKYSSADEMRRA